MLFNTKAFFLPTIMTFIVLFTTLMLFMTYQNLTETYLVKLYEQEVYYEIGIIKAKTYIKDYLTKSTEYLDVCEQGDYIYENEYLNVKVSPYCFFDNKIRVVKKLINKTSNLEDEYYKVTKEQYNKIVKYFKIGDYICNRNILSKILNKVLAKAKEALLAAEMSNAEALVIIEAAKANLDQKIVLYTAFSVEIDVQGTMYNMIYLYNFEDNKREIIKYT